MSLAEPENSHGWVRAVALLMSLDFGLVFLPPLCLPAGDSLLCGALERPWNVILNRLFPTES